MITEIFCICSLLQLLIDYLLLAYFFGSRFDYALVNYGGTRKNSCCHLSWGRLGRVTITSIIVVDPVVVVDFLFTSCLFF